jgi:hypothetical protein
LIYITYAYFPPRALILNPGGKVIRKSAGINRMPSRMKEPYRKGVANLLGVRSQQLPPSARGSYGKGARARTRKAVTAATALQGGLRPQGDFLIGDDN